MTQVVLITGGSRGIGESCARMFLREGYRVAVLYYSSNERAELLRSELGKNFLALQCDVANAVAVNAAFQKIQVAFGGVDILVNNAGIAQQKMLCDVTEQEWDRMFGVNITGMFHTVKCVMPHMIHRKKGRIINLSSIWGICGASCEVAYSASKAAVIGFTKALAKELGPSGICVNCVAPGVIDTEMNKMHDAETMEELKGETPLQRIGTPEDIASTVLFLASEKSDFITGQVISPNGGFVI